MHGSVRDDNEGSADDCEPNDIGPEREIVESERAQYTGTWYLDI